MCTWFCAFLNNSVPRQSHVFYKKQCDQISAYNKYNSYFTCAISHDIDLLQYSGTKGSTQHILEVFSSLDQWFQGCSLFQIMPTNNTWYIYIYLALKNCRFGYIEVQIYICHGVWFNKFILVGGWTLYSRHIIYHVFITRVII